MKINLNITNAFSIDSIKGKIKTLDIVNKLPIVFITAVAASCVLFISRKISEMRELRYIYKECDCGPKDIIKLSLNEFREASGFLFRKYNFSLFDNCKIGTKKNMFLTTREGREMYSKAISIKNPGPFFGKEYSSILYFDSNDEIYNSIRKEGSPLMFSPEFNAVIMDKTDFMNFLMEKAKSKYTNKPSFTAIPEEAYKAMRSNLDTARSEYLSTTVQQLKAKGTIVYGDLDTSQFDNCYTVVGKAGGDVYVVHEKDALDPYIEKFPSISLEESPDHPTEESPTHSTEEE